MAQVKRVYEVYADTEDDACELLNAHGADVLVYEEEINEDIDDVSALSKALGERKARELLAEINRLEGSLSELVCDALHSGTRRSLAASLDAGELAEIERRTGLLLLSHAGGER